MNSPSSNHSSYPVITSAKTFDLCSMSCDLEECFEPVEGYITPRVMSPFSENPPRFVLFQSTPIALSDIDSLSSELFLPDPLDDYGEETESSTTTLLPRYVSLNIENRHLDQLSVPSLENLTADTRDEQDSQTTDGYSSSLTVKTTSIDSAPLLAQQREELGYDSLPEESSPSLPDKKLSLSPSSSSSIHLASVRRNSIGAYAA